MYCATLTVKPGSASAFSVGRQSKQSLADGCFETIAFMNTAFTFQQREQIAPTSPIEQSYTQCSVLPPVLALAPAELGLDNERTAVNRINYRVA
jgi:hypothetical protein